MGKKCIILRGVPGSGKSALAWDLHEEAKGAGLRAYVASADHHFHQAVDPDDPSKGSVYRYDPGKIGDAHRDCRRQAETAMRSGFDLVLIDNTNIRAREVFPYVEMAVCYDYEVEFREPHTPWWLAVRSLLQGNKQEKELRNHSRVFAERNIHGVPEATILKMLTRWDSDLTVDRVLQEG